MYRVLPHWELWWMALDPIGSCFGHCLEYSRHALTASTKSLYFKGNLASLAICHPTWVQRCLFFLYTKSALSTEGSAARAHTYFITFLITKVCQKIMSQDVEDSKDCFRFLQVNPNVFPLS